MGFAAGDLKQTIVYDDSPNADGGGLWESGAGITADSHGHLYIVTGNGPYDLNTGGADAGDWVLAMEPRGGTLVAVEARRLHRGPGARVLLGLAGRDRRGQDPAGVGRPDGSRRHVGNLGLLA